MIVERCFRCKKDGFFCEQGPTGSRTIINTKTYEWLDLPNRRIEDCPTVISPKGRHNVKKRENFSATITP